MRIWRKFAGYNPRRYGKPWIVRITSWPVGGKPDVEWGTYIGDDNGGEVEIQADAGDIVRIGQNDYRGGKSFAGWYIVQADGTLRETDAAGARKAYDERIAEMSTENPPHDLSMVSNEELVAECKRRGIEVLK